MKTGITGIVFTCAAWAQPPVQTPEQVEALLERDLRGSAFRTAGPDPSWEASIARPAAEAFSVSKALHHPPKEARRALARAGKLRRTSHHAEAVSELEAATQLDPLFGDAYQWLGVEYAETGRLAEAVASFRRLLELEPDNWRAHYNLGLSLLRSGQYAEAETRARRALRLAPTDPRVNLLFGCALAARPETRSQAAPYVQFAARTMPEARRLLRQLNER